MPNPFQQVSDVLPGAGGAVPAKKIVPPPPSLDALMSDAAGRVRADTGVEANVAPLPGWAQSGLSLAGLFGYKPQGYTLGNSVYYNPPAFEGSNPTDMQDFLTHEFTHVKQAQRPGGGMFSSFPEMLQPHDDRASEIEAEQAVRDRTHAGQTYRPFAPK